MCCNKAQTLDSNGMDLIPDLIFNSCVIKATRLYSLTLGVNIKDNAYKSMQHSLWHNARP